MTRELCAASPFAAPPTRQTTPRADWPRTPVSRPQTPLSAPRPRPPANNKQSSKILRKKGGEGGEERERANLKPILRALRTVQRTETWEDRGGKKESRPGAMGPAARWWCRGKKVGEHPAGRAWQSRGTLGPGSCRAWGFGAVRGRPRGWRVRHAGAARAEPADTCGRRAGARRTGSPGARGGSSRARLFTSARGCYF